MAKTKKHIEAHSANKKFGMGDYYGTAQKEPIGKARSDSMMQPVKKSKLKKPPRSLA